MRVMIRTQVSKMLIVDMKSYFDNFLKKEFAQAFTKDLLKFFRPKDIKKEDTFQHPDIQTFVTEFHIVKSEDFEKVMISIRVLKRLSRSNAETEHINRVEYYISKDYKTLEDDIQS